jgi:hypothetical protein
MMSARLPVICPVMPTDFTEGDWSAVAGPTSNYANPVPTCPAPVTGETRLHALFIGPSDFSAIFPPDAYSFPCPIFSLPGEYRWDQLAAPKKNGEFDHNAARDMTNRRAARERPLTDAERSKNATKSKVRTKS